MKKYDKLVKNAAGRMVPTIINGENHIPFQGVGKYNPTGRRYGPKIPTCNDFPDGNKEVSTLKEALINAGIKDGMTISSHHHFRNGDLIAKQVFDIAHDLGIKNLRW
ncbi:MAG: citrate lyase subunit alpha, partial [Lentimicrobiaceae bacterium]|nr:citrate lyase subunit alpha [Lentimicrobiaceae bacterium]